MRFVYQKDRKRESEEKIIQALLVEEERGKSFTELLLFTGLSKPILSRRLRKMMEEERIDKTLSPEKNKILYTLTKKSLNSHYAKHFLLYRSLVNEALKEADNVYQNKPFLEYLQFLSRTIGALTLNALAMEKDVKWLDTYHSILVDKLIKIPTDTEKMKETLKEIYPEETTLFGRLWMEFIVSIL